jgi:DNA ligase (NAD+)
MIEFFKAPTNCPMCGEKLFIESVFLVCKNESCCGNEIGNLVKWVKSIGLKNIASATLEKLYEAGLVKNPSDLYRLKPNMICELEGFGSSSANKIVDTLNAKKEVSLPEFIGGLNISNFSDKTAELLEENGLDNVWDILEKSNDELSSIKGIGDITAKAIRDGLSKKINVIHELFSVGIKIMKKEKKEVKSGSPFVGKKVVFTGALNIKRADAQKMVIEVGGECPNSLAKDTDFLVMAETDSTSAKAQKAEKYGTKIIDEAEFMRMIKS